MTVGELKVQMKNNYSLGVFLHRGSIYHMKRIQVVEIKRLLCLKKIVTSVRIFNSKMLMEMEKLVEYM